MAADMPSRFFLRRGPRRRSLFIALAGLAALALHVNPAPVYAQSGTWTANGNAANSNATWGRTGNWSGGIVAGGTDATARFTAASGNTYAALTNDIALGNLTTAAGRVYFTGTDTNYALQFPPSAYQLVLATTTGTAPAITNAGRVDMTVTVAGTQGFTKSGNGVLYLFGTNAYSGVTTISGSSQIYLRNADGLGATGVGNGTVVQAGSTLRIDVPITTAPEPLTISGSGQSGSGFLGALRTNNSSSFSDYIANYTGPITLAANAKITAAPGLPLILSGSIDLGANALQLEDGGDISVTGPIGGAGSVTYVGTGPAGFVMSGSSTFTGPMTVGNAGGPFSMTGYLAAATTVGGGQGRYVIGTGTFAGGLTVNNTIQLSPGASGTAAGDSYGTITASTLTVQSGNVLLGVQNATTYDRLVMTAGSGGLTLGGSASLTIDFASAILPASLDLLSFTGLSGNFQSVTSTGVYAGTWTNIGGIWSLENVGPGGTDSLSFNLATGDLAVIPEPSTFVLLGGGVAVAALLHRRHRRNPSGNLAASPLS